MRNRKRRARNVPATRSSSPTGFRHSLVLALRPVLYSSSIYSWLLRYFAVAAAILGIHFYFGQESLDFKTGDSRTGETTAILVAILVSGTGALSWSGLLFFLSRKVKKLKIPDLRFPHSLTRPQLFATVLALPLMREPARVSLTLLVEQLLSFGSILPAAGLLSLAVFVWTLFTQRARRKREAEQLFRFRLALALLCSLESFLLLLSYFIFGSLVAMVFASLVITGLAALNFRDRELDRSTQIETHANDTQKGFSKVMRILTNRKTNQKTRSTV